jgi:hypothetical protein
MPPFHFLKAHFNIIHLRLGLPSGRLPSGLPTKILYAPEDKLRHNFDFAAIGNNMADARTLEARATRVGYLGVVQFRILTELTGGGNESFVKVVFLLNLK